MQRALISRTYLLRSMLFAALLLWPLLIMGRPAYMLDSGYYQNGGRAATAFVEEKLHIPAKEDAKPHATPPSGGSDSKVVARAVTYSVLAYLLKGPGLTMVYLAVFQALCTGLTATALWTALAGPSTGRFAAMLGLMLTGTALAPLVNFMVPDVFTGIMLGIVAVLSFFWRRFSGPMLILLILMATLGISVHPSHPPVAIGTALLTSLMIFLFRRTPASGQGRHLMKMVWIPALAGVALTIATGIVGFGRIGIAPKGFPFALARSLENGPALWFLRAECANDPRRYTICQVYGSGIPDTTWDFLFGPDNVVNRSTPDQLDRIRLEEKTILLRTTLRYPGYQAYIVLRDIPLQFVHIELDYLRYDGEIKPLPGGKVLLYQSADGNAEAQVPPLIEALNVISIIVVLASAAALGWYWRRLSFDQRGVVLALAAGLLANAAVCGLISGVAPRYQARLMWLVPFVALALTTEARRNGNPEQGSTA